MLELAQVGPLQEVLVLLNRPADLTFLAVEVPQYQMDFERVAGRGCPCQLVDRPLGLVRHQEIQAEHVVG